MNVLIVDDDPIALGMLGKVLAHEGHDVETASNGRQALDVLRTGETRLVITDWDMPVMDGVQLCREIRTDFFGGYVYVILLTSKDSPEETIEGLGAGADDFVCKPFRPAELIARVQSGERVLSLETRDVAIFALAKLTESRDPETGAHIERVQNYSRVLAQQLASQTKTRHLLDAEYIRLIYQTSPLHDIGKVGIPDSVLLKPGRLSDREFEVMKSHAMIGEQTLDAALKKFPEARFLQMARDIAGAHHERWDGTGYPRGLSGTGIPLAGRIVALADVYDALTTKRVYKDEFSHDMARAIILEESGSHFDPDVVDAFIQAEAQFIAIRERFRDG